MTVNAAEESGRTPVKWCVALLLALPLLAVTWWGDVARSVVPDASQPSPAVVKLEGESGEAVFKSFCAVCHQLPMVGKGVNIPPDLRYEGSRVQYDWLIEYLGDPARPRLRWQSEGVRPALTMPAFRMNRELTEDMARYLISMQDSALIVPSGIDWESISSLEAVDEGGKLFGEYQCRGCHSLGGTGNQIGPGLDGVGSRLRPDFMYRWILEPEKIVPGTPMTNKGLWEEEAQSLVLFLRTLKTAK